MSFLSSRVPLHGSHHIAIPDLSHPEESLYPYSLSCRYGSCDGRNLPVYRSHVSSTVRTTDAFFDIPCFSVSMSCLNRTYGRNFLPLSSLSFHQNIFSYRYHQSKKASCKESEKRDMEKKVGDIYIKMTRHKNESSRKRERKNQTRRVPRGERSLFNSPRIHHITGKLVRLRLFNKLSLKYALFKGFTPIVFFDVR